MLARENRSEFKVELQIKLLISGKASNIIEIEYFTESIKRCEEMRNISDQ